MKLSAIVKKIAPPVILEMVLSLPEFRSWDEALKKSTESAYENNKLTKLVLEKTKDYRNKLSNGIILINNSEIQTLTALGIALSSQQYPTKITVLDFGGACGAHFFLAKNIFSTVEFDWRVVETVEMVREARNLESSELHFYSNIEDAVANTNSVHLVHSSGTLQYMPDPYTSLEQLVNIKADYILLSRLGVTPETSEIITIQKHMMSLNGPGIAPKDFKDEICIYPCQYPIRSKIESILSESYAIKFLNDDPSGKFSVGSRKITGLTYFCENKKSMGKELSDHK
jgi:putative methyltransferase (TIGR04325 family)